MLNMYLLTFSRRATVSCNASSTAMAAFEGSITGLKVVGKAVHEAVGPDKETG